MKKQIKWGVIGCGGIADRRALPGLIQCDNARLVACMGRKKEVAERVAAKYGAEFACTEVSELLQKDIDAVYIATPVYCHEEQSLAALAAGKHVLVEKPVALNGTGAARLVEKFRGSGLRFEAGYMMRQHSLHRKMREIYREGGIGRSVSLDLQFSCWYPRDASAWRQDATKSGGGALMDLGVHCLDLLFFLTGESVTDVCGYWDAQTPDYPVDESANILLRLKSGATARVQVNFNVPDALPSRVEWKGKEGSLVAEGSLGQEDTGTLKWIHAPQAAYDAVQRRPEPRTETFEGEGGDLYTRQFEGFSARILEGATDYDFADSSVEVQKIVDRVYAMKGQRATTE